MQRINQTGAIPSIFLGLSRPVIVPVHVCKSHTNTTPLPLTDPADGTSERDQKQKSAVLIYVQLAIIIFVFYFPFLRLYFFCRLSPGGLREGEGGG